MSKSEGDVFTLKDGRKLGYIEYGDQKGKPIFFFHGWPGSRYSGKETDKAAKMECVFREGLVGQIIIDFRYYEC